MITIIARVSEIIKAIKAKISHHESQNDDVLNREQEEAAAETAVDDAIDKFRHTVGVLASLNGFAGLPAIKAIQDNARWIIGEGLQEQYYASLMIRNLTYEDRLNRAIHIEESLADRTIPLTDLFDRVLLYQNPVRLFVNGAGMSVQTSSGYTIRIAECKIFLNRLNDKRWTCAYAMIEHVTRGAIKLNAVDLLGVTDCVDVRNLNGKWTVDFGIHATSS